MSFHRYFLVPHTYSLLEQLLLAYTPLLTLGHVIFWLTGTFVRVSLSFARNPPEKGLVYLGFMNRRHDMTE